MSRRKIMDGRKVQDDKKGLQDDKKGLHDEKFSLNYLRLGIAIHSIKACDCPPNLSGTPFLRCSLQGLD